MAMNYKAIMKYRNINGVCVDICGGCARCGVRGGRTWARSTSCRTVRTLIGRHHGGCAVAGERIFLFAYVLNNGTIELFCRMALTDMRVPYAAHMRAATAAARRRCGKLCHGAAHQPYGTLRALCGVCALRNASAGAAFRTAHHRRRLMDRVHNVLISAACCHFTLHSSSDHAYLDAHASRFRHCCRRLVTPSGRAARRRGTPRWCSRRRFHWRMLFRLSPSLNISSRCAHISPSRRSGGVTCLSIGRKWAGVVFLAAASFG